MMAAIYQKGTGRKLAIASDLFITSSAMAALSIQMRVYKGARHSAYGHAAVLGSESQQAAALAFLVISYLLGSIALAKASQKQP